MSLLSPLNDQHLVSYGKNWRLFLLWGILLVLLGIFAISATTLTTLVTIVVLGFLILFSGAIIVVDAFTFWWKKWSGFFIHFIIGILYLLVGYLLITNPIEGSVSLTLLLGIFYLVIGVFRTAMSSSLRSPQWGWVLFSGLISLILGILILTSWPASGLFVIGLFIGIDLLFSGWAYIVSALAGKKLLI